MIEINKPLRSFGRIKNRIKDRENLLGKLLPKFLIKIEEGEKTDPKKLFQNSKEIHLEIGFGQGQSIFERAKKNPDIGFIGCEVYLNGVLNLLRKIKEHKVKNIRLFTKDARILIENLKDNSLDKVFILFPDPWPKKRHHKRRIINSDFLNVLHFKLKKNGILFFASDIEHYVNWTLEHIEKNGKFVANFGSLKECEKKPDWWIETKYQKKAVRENRVCKFMEFENK